MKKLSSYQLFISSACNCCDKVIHQLKHDKLDITTVNIDKDTYQLPFSVMMLPALIKEEKLIAYGANDILKHLKELNCKQDIHSL